MTPTISFTFPHNATYMEVIAAINTHYEIAASDVTCGPGTLDVADDPSEGVRNAAYVFGGEQDPVRNPAAVFTGQPQNATINAGDSGAAVYDPNVRDSEGYMWDERIHSGNKKMTTKNVWVKRKGVTPVDHKRICGELIAAGKVVVPTAGATQQQTSTVPNYPTQAAADAMHAQMAEKIARMKWAQDTATQQLGMYPGLPATFEKLKSGEPANLTAQESDYFSQWSAMVAKLFADNAPVVQQPAVQQQAPATFQYDPTSAGTVQGQQAQTVAHNAPAAASTVPQHDINTAPGFAMFVSNAMRDGKITVEQLNETIAQSGVIGPDNQSNLSAVIKMPQMIPAVLAMLAALNNLHP